MTADNESEQTIFKKGKYEKNFTTVSNNTFKNVVLSWKAKGLLIYLLTLPDDWKISLAHLIKQAPDGRDSLMGGVMELRKAGHIKIRENQRREGKFAGVTYLIYEEPQAPDDDALEPTTNGKTATGKSVYGKTGYGKTGYGKSAPTKYLLNKRPNDKIKDDEEEERNENFNSSIQKQNQETAKVFKSYESEIGVLTSLIGNEIKAFLEQDNVSPDWIIAAIEEASRNNKRSWSYISAIIKRWQVEGFQSSNKPESKSSGKPQAKSKAKPQTAGRYVPEHEESQTIVKGGTTYFIEGKNRLAGDDVELQF